MIEVLSTAIVVIAAIPAKAGVVAFQNPQGAGHFDWVPATNQNGLNSIWLDITLPASSQPGTALGVSSYGQENYNDMASKILGVFGEAEIQVGNNSSLVWASASAEPIPASPAPANHGWSENPFIEVPAFGTNFVDRQESFVGVRFDPGDGWHYGWIGVVKTGIGLDAFAWGYETEPGVPICAGASADDPDCTGGTSAGDMNDDGVVDFADVEGFVGVLLGNPTPPGIIPDRADMDGDGDEDGQDIQPFVDALVP